MRTPEQRQHHREYMRRVRSGEVAAAKEREAERLKALLDDPHAPMKELQRFGRRIYMRQVRSAGIDEVRRRKRERMAQLRTSPEYRQEECGRQALARKLRREQRNLCYAPGCIRTATTMLTRGFITKGGEIVERIVPYCGVC